MRPFSFSCAAMGCLGVTSLFALGIVLSALQAGQGYKARQIVCLQNEKMLGLAIMQYAQDNDDRLPPRQLLVSGGKLVSWRALIFPYIKSKAIYRCPTNPAADAEQTDGNDIERDGFSRSYAVNATRSQQGFGPFAGKFAPGLALSKIAHPESVIAVVESTAAYNDFDAVFPGAYAQPTNTQTDSGHLYSGHNGWTNILFCDAHVQTRRTPNLTANTATLSWTVNGAPLTPSDRAKVLQVMKYSEEQNH